jgi:hypothetical protein
MDLAPLLAAPTSLSGDPAGALAALRIRKLEDISGAGVKLAVQIRERADATLGGGLVDAWGFARLARGVRQTVAMEIRLCGCIDPGRTARQMAKLAAVSDAGMALARLLERLLSEQKSPALDIVGQFLRVARSVRLVIAMEDWVDTDRRMPEAQRVAARARRAAEAAAIAARARQRRAEKAQDAAGADAFVSAAGLKDEDLYEPDIHAEIGDRSVAEVVGAACKDIGVDCDLGLFAEAADEAGADAGTLTPALSHGAGEGALAAEVGDSLEAYDFEQDPEALRRIEVIGSKIRAILSGSEAEGPGRDGDAGARATPTRASGHDPP